MKSPGSHACCLALVLLLAVGDSLFETSTGVFGKECTNIPTQPQGFLQRQREYAMRQILQVAGAAASGHGHDHDHPEFPDHGRLLLAKGQDQAQLHIHGWGANTGSSATVEESHTHSWEANTGRTGRAEAHGVGDHGGGMGEQGEHEHGFGDAGTLHLLSPLHKGPTLKEKRTLRKMISRQQEQQRQQSRSPGFNQGLPAVAGQPATTPAFLHEFPLHQVRLGAPGDSPQATAQDTNLRYLLSLDPDRLLWSFRYTAGLPTVGEGPHGGWESPGSELRGHFVGHYLSATAMAWASTGNESLKAAMDYVVNELSSCQVALGTGYLSAFPSEFFDRFEAIQPVWAPYYTIHKIMAGLLDQCQLAGNVLALSMVTKMADYFKGRVDAVIEKYTIERHWQSLNEEFGGMNDILYRLYTVTGNSEHLKLAHLFDKPCFLGPLALQTDDLSGFHSNSHIPIIIGCQSRYEVTGDIMYKEISEYFMRIVNTSHSFSSGGTSSFEFWKDPHRTGDQLAQEDQESCTTYNMLKISRTLFRWTREVHHADYYEKALLNGVLGIQRGTDPGVMIYMLPHGPGNSKARGYHGWGTPFNSFWCCYGTGIESFAKLGDSIYYHALATEDHAFPVMYVAQYVSSTVDWINAGVALSQQVDQPTSADPVVRVVLSVSGLEAGDEEERRLSGSGVAFGLRLRVPGWAAALPQGLGATSCNKINKDSRLGNLEKGNGGGIDPGCVASSGCDTKLNGVPLACSTPGSFLDVSRTWHAGDKVELSIRLGLRTERIQDDRPRYASLHSIFIGPYLLAGMTAGDNTLASSFDAAQPWKSIAPLPPSANQELVTLFAANQGGQQGEEWALSCGSPSVAAQMEQSPVLGSDSSMYSTFRAVREQGLGVENVNAQDESQYGSASRKFQERGYKTEVLERSVEGTVSTRRRALEDSPGRALEDSPGLSALGAYVVGVPISFELFHMPGYVLYWDPVRNELRAGRRRDAGIRKSSGVRLHVFVLVSTNDQSDSFTLQLFDERGTQVSVNAQLATSLAPEMHQPLVQHFRVERGLAKYSDLSFTAKGQSRDFVLQPISYLRDESYTSYFNVTSYF